MNDPKGWAYRPSMAARRAPMRLAAAVAAIACAPFLLAIARTTPGPKSASPTARTVQTSRRLPFASRAVLTAISRAPFRFELNQGQTDEQVKFLARIGNSTLFLTSNEAVIARRNSRRPLRVTRHGELEHSQDIMEAPAVLRVKFDGANPKPELTGLKHETGTSNYFLGADHAKWRTNVPQYAKVKYKNLYPGIDLVFYGDSGQLEFDFILEPGAWRSELAAQTQVISRRQIIALRRSQREQVAPPT
jgi:hypothetical protein